MSPAEAHYCFDFKDLIWITDPFRPTQMLGVPFDLANIFASACCIIEQQKTAGKAATFRSGNFNSLAAIAHFYGISGRGASADSAGGRLWA